jgi:hypothetical protein
MVARGVGRRCLVASGLCAPGGPSTVSTKNGYARPEAATSLWRPFSHLSPGSLGVKSVTSQMRRYRACGRTGT